MTQSNQSQADRGEEISLTPSVREYILAAHDHSCKECDATSEEETLHIHHIKPRAEGGTNHPSNLTVYCEECHRQIHSNDSKEGNPGKQSGGTPSLQQITEAPDVEPVPADSQIISAVDAVGPAKTGAIADEAGVTPQYARRRLYALGGAKLIAKSEDGYWDFREKVENPAVGKLPDDPEQAARFARDDLMRRMSDAGMDNSEIAEIVGLGERTVPAAINRARAFDPPLPPVTDETEIDRESLHHQLVALSNRVDRLESNLGSGVAD